MSGTPSNVVLCYVKDETHTAYFTSRPLADQWGDDWNDRPYEHNAGTPSTWRDVATGGWEIVEVEFHCGDRFKSPAQRSQTSKGGSSYSVEDINKSGGHIPWLTDTAFKLPSILPGCPLHKFIHTILSAGGACRLPDGKWVAASTVIPTPDVQLESSPSLSSIEERVRRLEVDSHPKVETVPLGRFVALESATRTNYELIKRSVDLQEKAAAAYVKSVEVLERIEGSIGRVAACYSPSVVACTHADNNAQLYKYDNFVIHWCHDCGATKIGNGEWRVPPTRP